MFWHIYFKFSNVYYIRHCFLDTYNIMLYFFYWYMQCKMMKSNTFLHAVRILFRSCSISYLFYIVLKEYYVRVPNSIKSQMSQKINFQMLSQLYNCVYLIGFVLIIMKCVLPGGALFWVHCNWKKVEKKSQTKNCRSFPSLSVLCALILALNTSS